MNQFNSLLVSQKEYLQKIETISVEKRIESLKKLKDAIKRYEKEIISALSTDLGKHEFEAYTHEIGLSYNNIDYALRNIRKWAKPKKIKNSLAQLTGKSMVYPSAYGSVLIIGAYNYPFHLVVEPLIGALSGGNTAVIKPSEFAEATEKILKKVITEAFPENYVAVVTGDYKVNSSLLDLPFDYIFFTGSVKVGKIVMEKASQNLVPVTLELGGKSPAIVDSSANLKLASDKIVWGKLLNSGQTCLAPDYVLVHRDVSNKFLKELKSSIEKFYGENIVENEDYGRIINRKHTERLANIIENDRDKIAFGGEYELENRYVSPTILFDADLESSSMKEEIFGPILPVVIYSELKDIERVVSANPKPLAFYVFSENKALAEKIVSKFDFGGGCINDTIIHVASHHLPFGGVGNSGNGRYHGKYSFNTFTYEKSIVKKTSIFSIDFPFPPYKKKLKLVRKIFK